MRVGPLNRKESVFDEKDKMWFYHAVGSGIYVRTATFAQIEVHYILHMSVPRTEILARLPPAAAAAALADRHSSRGAAFWPPSVTFELRDGSRCASTARPARPPV